MITTTTGGSMAKPAVRTTMTMVTPKMASEWLAANNNGNRRLRKETVAGLAVTIGRGGWEVTHQGIGFYEDGTLADGQHRLHAIVAAGTPVWANVTTGLRREANHAIDRGIGRNHVDSLHFMGVKADTKRVAACQCMIHQHRAESEGEEKWGTTKSPSDEFARFYEAFLPSIDFAIGRGCSKYPAPLAAAVATAWWSQDRVRLDEFLSVVNEGVVSSNADIAAVRIRDHLEGKKYGQGATARHELFLRCCSSLRYFLAGKPLAKLYATAENAFPFVDAVGEVL